jgi:hypothetical protein
LPDADGWLAAAVAASRRYRSPDPLVREAAALQAAAGRLGLDAGRLSAAQRSMLARWSGLALALTASGRWTSPERRALGRIIVAKAGPAEREFQRQLLRHRRLRRLLDC